jgi:hypothetical protein
MNNSKIIKFVIISFYNNNMLILGMYIFKFSITIKQEYKSEHQTNFIRISVD